MEQEPIDHKLDEKAELPKLYTQRAIAVANYLGSPIAASILIRKNLINLGKEKQGLYALLLGIAATVLIFAGLFSLQDAIIDKIPGPLIPLIYTGITAGIVHWLMGKTLEEHQAKNGPFYPVSRAVGIGVALAAVYVGAFFAIMYSQPDEWDYMAYNDKIEQFNNNENEALVLFEMFESDANPTELNRFIEEIGLPKWKENVVIIRNLEKMDDLPEEFITQNNTLLEISRLRVESYQLLAKAIGEETDEYDFEIQSLHEKISKLNESL